MLVFTNVQIYCAKHFSYLELLLYEEVYNFNYS